MSSKRFSLENAFTPQMKRLSLDDTKEYKQSIYGKVTINLLFKKLFKHLKKLINIYCILN